MTNGVPDVAIAMGEAIAWAEGLPPGSTLREFGLFGEGGAVGWEGKVEILGGTDHPQPQRDSSLAREFRTRNRAMITATCIAALGDVDRLIANVPASPPVPPPQTGKPETIEERARARRRRR